MAYKPSNKKNRVKTKAVPPEFHEYIKAKKLEYAWEVAGDAMAELFLAGCDPVTVLRYVEMYYGPQTVDFRPMPPRSQPTTVAEGMTPPPLITREDEKKDIGT